MDGVLVDSEEYIAKYLRDVDVKDYDGFWESIPEMKVLEWGKTMLNLYSDAGYVILILTARQDIPIAREKTMKWLNHNNIKYHKIFFQNERNKEIRDNPYTHGEIKVKIYKEQIEPIFDVELIIDDNPSNVKVFRDLGLTVLQPNNEWD